MSFPYVGIPDFGFEKWDAADIEDALRKGGYIYEDNDTDYTWFDPAAEQFVHTYNATDHFSQPTGEVKERRFDSFLELAAWLAFMGKDLL